MRLKNQKLRFNVTGPADIVGVINGDINSNELTVGDTPSLYNGSAVVILRSRTEPGTVTLEVTGDELSPVSLKQTTL